MDLLMDSSKQSNLRGLRMNTKNRATSGKKSTAKWLIPLLVSTVDLNRKLAAARPKNELKHFRHHPSYHDIHPDLQKLYLGISSSDSLIFDFKLYLRAFKHIATFNIHFLENSISLDRMCAKKTWLSF